MERMKLAEAAARLQVTPDTLRQQIHNKRLRARRLGRNWYVSPEEVERYARESAGKPGRKKRSDADKPKPKKPKKRERD